MLNSREFINMSAVMKLCSAIGIFKMGILFHGFKIYRDFLKVRKSPSLRQTVLFCALVCQINKEYIIR